jgi:DNA-binding response OmpR family regulator
MPTLLIIDDERNVLYSLEKGLAADDLRIVTAPTARGGIAAVSDERPDAALLDVQLPDLSGLDALLQIRERDPKLPVIIMTAHGTAETAIEAMKRGAFDYVLKPWKLAELKQIVHGALQAGRISRVPAVFEETADDLAEMHFERQLESTWRPQQGRRLILLRHGITSIPSVCSQPRRCLLTPNPGHTETRQRSMAQRPSLISILHGNCWR